MWPNARENAGLRPPRTIQIPAQLEIHPVALGGAEVLRQPQGCRRRDPPPRVHDLIDALVRHVESACQFSLADLHRLEELLKQHLTRMGGLSVCGNTHHVYLPYPRTLRLVIVDDLDLFRPLRCPDETDPILFVDTDAVLACPMSAQGLKSIARRDSKILQLLSRVDLIELPSGDCPEPLRTQFSRGSRIHTVEDVFGGLVVEALDHGYMITRLPCYGKPKQTSTTRCPTGDSTHFDHRRHPAAELAPQNAPGQARTAPSSLAKNTAARIPWPLQSP